MASQKTTALSITSLVPTAEDSWLRKWYRQYPQKIYSSPQFFYLIGDYKPMYDWMEFRKLPYTYLTSPLMFLVPSIMQEGQIHPIKVYKNKQIVTGHKRAAVMYYLGYGMINAVIVDDNYKL